MENKLSVVIIAKNEEKHIGDTVKSASFADEVFILDNGSTDKTIEIARKLGARVEYQEWLGFGKQKQAAVDRAKNDWVFVLDSDERITEELKNEILKKLEHPYFDGYLVPRLNNFFGKNIRHSGLYPDYTIRLFNRNKGKFNELEVHESVDINGKLGKLKNHMIHFPYQTIEQFIAKQNKYSSLHGNKKNLLKAIINPYWTFFQSYVLKFGFLDGWHGFIIAKLYSQYTFWKYIK